jgi:hypothetical protein
MDDRLAGVAAAVVGAALVAVGTLEYGRPGGPPPPGEPFATGLLVVTAGVSLLAAGVIAVLSGIDHLALRLGSGIGLVTLAIAVLAPPALLFGGVFWLGLLFAAVIVVAATRTAIRARTDGG